MLNILRKLTLALSFIMLTSTLTGCNIKFIEKAPPKESTETSEDLGEVIVNPNDSDHMTIESSETESNETPSIEKPTEPEPESSETSESIESSETTTLKENQQEVNGVIFNMDTREMFAKSDAKLYASAKLTGKSSSGVSQGSKVTVLGISEDGKVAMVKIASGPLYFMSYSFLSVDFVEYSTESSEEPPESTPESSQTSESTRPPESTSQSTTPPPESSERPPESTTRPSESSEEPPENSERPTQPPVEERPAGGGIPYPDNPESTSINFGVVFADVNFTATTVSNNTVITSGPGKALPSNGYVELKTLYKGLTVTCTGIGQNGYIRILMDDGRVGFILNTNLKR